MAGHYIVCGLGRVGYRIVNLLRRLGEDVTIITLAPREEWRREMEEAGLTVLEGDARDDKLLAAAGLQSACALVTATSLDLVNIEIALDAKRQRPDLPIVLRIFDQNLALQLEAGFEIRRALSMSATAAPTFAAAAMGEHVITAFRMESSLVVVGRLALSPDSPAVGMTVGQAGERHQVAMVAMECAGVPPASALDPETVLQAGDCVIGMGDRSDWDRMAGLPRPGAPSRTRLHTLRMSLLRAVHPALWLDLARQMWTHTPLPLRTVFIILNLLMVCSLFVFHYGMKLTLTDALYFLISTVTTTGYGDINAAHSTTALKLYACLVMVLGPAMLATLYSIITDFIVTARFQQLLGRQRIPQRGHFIVAGMGSVGYRLVDKLRRVGARVVAIDRDMNKEFIEDVRAHTPVVVGDARLSDTLRKAGVEHAAAVLAVTNDDAANLGIGLQAKQMNPEVRTVVRLFDSEFARKVQAILPIDAAMGAFAIGAPVFVASALYPNVEAAFEADGRLFAILERSVGEEWHGLRPSRLQAERGVRVLMRLRAGGSGYRVFAHDVPLDRTERVLAVVWRPLRP